MCHLCIVSKKTWDMERLPYVSAEKIYRPDIFFLPYWKVFFTDFLFIFCGSEHNTQPFSSYDTATWVYLHSLSMSLWMAD